jgi:hypothetical protein
VMCARVTEDHSGPCVFSQAALLERLSAKMAHSRPVMQRYLALF